MAPLSTLLLFAALGPANGAQHVEVYTMGQGQHLFERFGHAAICVVPEQAPEQGRCYNYGTTDFSTPPQEIGWDFLRGNARFWVSVWPLPRMVAAYAGNDRDVYRQRLPLTPAQVARVDARLRHDAREENRYYRYHHFDDNCTTRVRDVVDEATDGALSAGGARRYPETLRTMGARGLGDEPWLVVLGHLLTGRRLDQPLEVREAMFHPDVLRAELLRRLRAEPELVHRRRGAAFASEPPRSEGRFLALGLLAALPALAGRELPGGAGRAAASLAGLVLGLVGLLVWFVALSSSMRELCENEMLLVFWPWDLALGLLSARARQRYARLRVGWLLGVSVLAALGALDQPLLVPLLIPLLSFLLFSHRKLGPPAATATTRCASRPAA